MLIAVCKTQNEYESYSMLIKDHQVAVPLILIVDKIVGIPTDEQYEALMEILQMALMNKVSTQEIIDNIDLELAKKIVINYMGGYDYMYKGKITSGKVIEDRLGNEHKVYAMMLNKKTIKKIRELLPRIDSIVTVNNVLDVNDNGEYTDDAYNALLEIIKLALVDEKLTNKQLEEFLDVEFARKVIRSFLDLPIAG